MSEVLEAPTEPGFYQARCAETDHEDHLVEVYTGPDGRLWVEDDDVGQYPLDIYHSNLIDLRWEKVS